MRCDNELHTRNFNIRYMLVRSTLRIVAHMGLKHPIVVRVRLVCEVPLLGANRWSLRQSELEVSRSDTVEWKKQTLTTRKLLQRELMGKRDSSESAYGRKNFLL